MKRLLIIMIVLGLFSCENEQPSEDNVTISRQDVSYSVKGMSYNIAVKNDNDVKLDSVFIKMTLPTTTFEFYILDVEPNSTKLEKMTHTHHQGVVIMELVRVVF